MRRMTSRIKNAIACIREYRKKAGLARFKFACMAGIPEGSIRHIDDSSWNPTLGTDPFSFRPVDHA